MKRLLIGSAAAGAVVLALGTATAVAGGPLNFGLFRDKQLAAHSGQLFGVNGPLTASSTKQITEAAANADPTRLVTLAKGLHAHVVTTQGPAIDDQISLWPNANHPTYLIACNETGEPTEPGLVRIELSTGKVSTILRGTQECDPTRLTPWGTILFGEEDGPEGRLYELMDPIHTSNVQLDRTTGVFTGGTGAHNLVTRTALGTFAFEGMGILPDGTTYLDGDDSSFGPHDGGPGDAYFKFVPTHPFTGGAPITDLTQSPYGAGEVYGLRIGLGNDYGQGREYGVGQWIHLPHTTNPNLEAAGLAAGLSGYYRPEDMDLDPIATAKGNVRLCSNDTGDEENHLYGQTICITDGTISQAQANTASPSCSRSSSVGRAGASTCRTTSPSSRTPATRSSTRMPRPPSKARTTTTCGTACRTATTRTCSPTAAPASARSTT
jgi:hypothetical protein